MWFAINGCKCNKTTNDKARPFVQYQQSLLGILIANTKVTTEWLRRHTEQVLRYYWHMLRDMEQLDEAKKFTLAPASQIKSHILTIDTRALHFMMKNCGLFSGNLGKFEESRDEHFARCFEYSELRKGGTFSHMLQTDGVSVCFHFHVPKVEKRFPTIMLRTSLIVSSALIIAVAILSMAWMINSKKHTV